MRKLKKLHYEISLIIMFNYTTLREIQKKEMESSAFVPVENDFYEQLAKLLEQKHNEAQQSNSLLAIREYENIKKIIQTIQNKREEKIALMALRGNVESTGLSQEETQLLKKLHADIQQSRATVKKVWESEQSTAKKVRIMKEVERYKGLDNNIYGPFKPGEELLLPKEEAEWLLKANLAELTG